jgi:hypothetical protein
MAWFFGLFVSVVAGALALAIAGGVVIAVLLALKLVFTVALIPVRIAFGFVKFALFAAIGVALLACLLPLLVIAAIVFTPLIALGALGMAAAH